METSNGSKRLSSVFSHGENAHNAEVICQGNENETPVIILISIRSSDGSKTSPQNEQNYLRHFRKIYEEKGWIVVQCTPTDERISEGHAAEVASMVFLSLEKKGLQGNPVIIHVLSYEGLSVHNAICQAVRDERELRNTYFPIKGCILDSCPKQAEGLLRNLKELFPTAYDILMLMMWLIKAIFPEFFGGGAKTSDYEEFCYNSGTWPQMFLYSTTDHIVPHTDVEKAAGIRRQASVPVEQICWEDTEHARHFFVHEEEYTDLCYKFVQFCLL